MQKLGNQCFWTVQLAENTGQRTESEHDCKSRSVISQTVHCMGDAQRCRNALVQAAEEINRRPELLELRLTCIQSWQGSRALFFSKRPRPFPT